MSSYRWWTVFGWWTPDAKGAKLGPLTVTTYQVDMDFFSDGTHRFRAWFIGIANRWILLDTGLPKRPRGCP